MKPSDPGQYDPAFYGDHSAEIYDRIYASYERAAVQTLANLTRGGRALELGIGTGRVALPLVRAGVDLVGIEASEAMVAKLRAKPGGTLIPVVVGNFADVAVRGPFALVFTLVNTLFLLPSEEEQARCFRNVAATLGNGGLFVVEAFVPDLAHFDEPHEGDGPPPVHDRALQRYSARYPVQTERGTIYYSVDIRYAWPPELDAMASLAGLRLRARWASWEQRPFEADSDRHISVYERAR